MYAVDERAHAVGLHRLQAGLVEVADAVRPDQDARTRHTSVSGQAAEIPDVLTVRPVQPADARRPHRPTRRADLPSKWGGEVRYLFVYWGALRARFSPYFLRSFIRASRVSSPAFFNAARKSGSNGTGRGRCRARWRPPDRW